MDYVTAIVGNGNVLAKAVFVVAYLYSLPVIIFCGRHLYYNRNEQFMLKRHPSILICLLVLIAFATLVEYPFYSSTIALNSNYFSEKHVFFDIIQSVGLVSRPTLASLLSLRIYLLNYDHEYHHRLVVEKWKVLAYPHRKQNWYIQQRNKWGSPSFIMSRFIWPVTSLYLIISVIGFTVDLWIGAFCFIFNVLIALCFWRFCPKKVDLWAIREELFLSIFLFVLITLHYAANLSLHNELWESLEFAGIVAMEFLFPLLATVLVLYPQSRLYRREKQAKADDIRKNSGKHYSKFPSWTSIVSTVDGYDEFAHFLEREFAVHHLLFVTEYQMLKRAMVANKELEPIIGSGLFFQLDLPRAAPRSLISHKFIAEMDAGSNMYDVVLTFTKRLYLKYIDVQAANLRVTLSPELEMHLFSVFKTANSGNTLDIHYIMPFLEKAVLEVSSLMDDSYERFRRTDVFRDVTAPRMEEQRKRRMERQSIVRKAKEMERSRKRRSGKKVANVNARRGRRKVKVLKGKNDVNDQMEIKYSDGLRDNDASEISTFDDDYDSSDDEDEAGNREIGNLFESQHHHDHGDGVEVVYSKVDADDERKEEEDDEFQPLSRAQGHDNDDAQSAGSDYVLNVPRGLPPPPSSYPSTPDMVPPPAPPGPMLDTMQRLDESQLGR